jgi:glycosyltransferase involved in cell wall biosynthesis
MSLKRICMVVQNYYEIDPRVRREAESLVEAGYTVDVLSLRMANDRTKSFMINGVNVFTVPLGKKRAGKLQYILEYLSFFWWVSFALTKYSLRWHYGVVHVNTLPDFLIFAACIPKLMGAKLVLDMHEVMPEFYMSKFGVAENHWITKLLKWQEKLSIAFADHIITINVPVQALLESRGLPIGKSTIVMSSVDSQLFAQSLDSHERKRDDRPFVFMYHGTLTAMYGLDIAICAFAIAVQRIRNAEFWIVGDGPEHANLANLADQLGVAGKVKFLGQMPQQEIPKWVAQSDAGVLAMPQDVYLDLSFSNKLPEYIVMGKPVIVSRLKTLSYYFSEQALAFFEPQNKTALAEKMIEICENMQLRAGLTMQARQEYAAIDWSVMKQRYLKVIEDLLYS